MYVIEIYGFLCFSWPSKHHPINNFISGFDKRTCFLAWSWYVHSLFSIFFLQLGGVFHVEFCCCMVIFHDEFSWNGLEPQILCNTYFLRLLWFIFSYKKDSLYSIIQSWNQSIYRHVWLTLFRAKRSLLSSVHKRKKKDLNN